MAINSPVPISIIQVYRIGYFSGGWSATQISGWKQFQSILDSLVYNMIHCLDETRNKIRIRKRFIKYRWPVSVQWNVNRCSRETEFIPWFTRVCTFIFIFFYLTFYNLLYQFVDGHWTETGRMYLMIRLRIRKLRLFFIFIRTFINSSPFPAELQLTLLGRLKCHFSSPIFLTRTTAAAADVQIPSHLIMSEIGGISNVFEIAWYEYPQLPPLPRHNWELRRVILNYWPFTISIFLYFSRSL